MGFNFFVIKLACGVAGIMRAAKMHQETTMPEHYLDVTQEAGAALFSQNISGEVLMLNLLRFREFADYSDFPELEPADPISGREAYRRYVKHTTPFLQESGGSLMLMAGSGGNLIGPADEHWDVAMIVRQRSLADFLAFSSNPGFLAGAGHRKAALLDSRLLPMFESKDGTVP